LAADELFQLGDAHLLVVVLQLVPEQAGQAFEDGGFPVGEELGLELMLPADLGLAADAGQDLQDDLSFELPGERTTLAWHGKVPLSRPVFLMVLVQFKGRTSELF
jgi:hypothetical protein